MVRHYSRNSHTIRREPLQLPLTTPTPRVAYRALPMNTPDSGQPIMLTLLRSRLLPIKNPKMS